MKHLFLPILILSFSFASAQEVTTNQKDSILTVASEETVKEDKDLEVAYKSKALRDPDNIDFDNLFKERQLELFVTEGDNKVC